MSSVGNDEGLVWEDTMTGMHECRRIVGQSKRNRRGVQRDWKPRTATLVSSLPFLVTPEVEHGGRRATLLVLHQQSIIGEEEGNSNHTLNICSVQLNKDSERCSRWLTAGETEDRVEAFSSCFR